jgi:integrase
MPRKAAGLTAAKVRTAGPGKYGDGNGLQLVVTASGARSWSFRFMRQGKAREMGLGRADAAGEDGLSLAKARDKAAALHRLVADGIDPLAQRDADLAAEAARKAAEQAAAAKRKTFKEAAEAFIGSHEAGWRNAKHRQQWQNTLDTYADPVIGKVPVADIGTEQVLQVLTPLWTTKPETASRLRQRIERVLDYSRVRNWRAGENPARWRGHLDHLLPARGKVAKVVHHAALPWRDIPGFMTNLRRQDGVSPRALELLILTATRTSETLNATWGEIDLDAAVWTIPAARMKAGREHRVPLSDAAMAVLRGMAPLRNPGRGDWVFPGERQGRPLSNMSLLMVLRRMGRGDVTTHGFRSSFRDWTAERTSVQREVAEAALAHTLEDKVEAAYRRGDLFDKRTRLMADWAAYCAKGAAKAEENVVRLAAAG